MKKLWLLSVLVAFVACTHQTSKEAGGGELEQGKKIAQESFKALSSKLKQAMADGGPEHAVVFCNTAALPITDSLSQHFNATVKRTALKYRNPENKPDSTELNALVKYSNEIAEGGQPKPFITSINGTKRFIAPIPTKGLCLSCHGVPGKTIPQDLYTQITALYPEDMAVGFQEGDLRGIWSITFNK